MSNDDARTAYTSSACLVIRDRSTLQRSEFAVSSFGLRHSFDIRASTFIIRNSPPTVDQRHRLRPARRIVLEQPADGASDRQAAGFADTADRHAGVGGFQH